MRSPTSSTAARSSPRPPEGSRLAQSGMALPRLLVRTAGMSRTTLFLVVAAMAVLPGSPASAQTRRTELKTPAGRFSLEVTAEYLGMAAGKTVVRIRLASPELSRAAASRGVRTFSGELSGTFSRGNDMVQAFRYAISGDIMD